MQPPSTITDRRPPAGVGVGGLQAVKKAPSNPRLKFFSALRLCPPDHCPPLPPLPRSPGEASQAGTRCQRKARSAQRAACGLMSATHALGNGWMLVLLCWLAVMVGHGGGTGSNLCAEEPFLELEIERVPAVFSPEDEALIIVATVVAGHCGTLQAGQVVWAAALIDGEPMGVASRFPFPGIGHEFMETTLTLAIPLGMIPAGEHAVGIQVFAQESLGDAQIMSGAIMFEMLADASEADAATAHGAPGTADHVAGDSPLMRCLQARAPRVELDTEPAGNTGEDADQWEGCQHYLRHRLWAVPTYVTQTELAVLKSVSAGTFFGQPVDLDLLTLFPRDAPAPLRGSCAVVGSAGHLAQSFLGAAIDAHDFILRFNDAPAGSSPGMEHLAPHIGRRTTHRLLHAATGIVDWIHHKAGWLRNPELSEHLILRGDWEKDLVLFRELHHSGAAGGQAGMDDGGSRGVWMLSTAFNLFVWRWVGSRGHDKVPTSGMLGIMWALQSCDTVDTYGFGPLPPCLDSDHDVCHHPAARRQPVGGEYRYYINEEARKEGQASSQSTPWAFGHNWGKEERLHAILHNASLVRRHWFRKQES